MKDLYLKIVLTLILMGLVVLIFKPIRVEVSFEKNPIAKKYGL